MSTCGVTGFRNAWRSSMPGHFGGWKPPVPDGVDIADNFPNGLGLEDVAVVATALLPKAEFGWPSRPLHRTAWTQLPASGEYGLAAGPLTALRMAPMLYTSCLGPTTGGGHDQRRTADMTGDICSLGWRVVEPPRPPSRERRTIQLFTSVPAGMARRVSRPSGICRSG